MIVSVDFHMDPQQVAHEVSSAHSDIMLTVSSLPAPTVGSSGPRRVYESVVIVGDEVICTRISPDYASMLLVHADLVNRCGEYQDSLAAQAGDVYLRAHFRFIEAIAS